MRVSIIFIFILFRGQKYNLFFNCARKGGEKSGKKNNLAFYGTGNASRITVDLMSYFPKSAPKIREICPKSAPKKYLSSHEPGIGHCPELNT